MTDDEAIILAESLGFKFQKQKNSWHWSIIAPDEDARIYEQGDPLGMLWIREKLTKYEPEIRARELLTPTKEPAALELF